MNKTDKFLYKLKIHKKSWKQSPLIGWQENISSLYFFFKELNECYDVDFLLTRQLTQDCVENVYSVVRSNGGNNVNPDASKCNSSMWGNCEIEMSQKMLIFLSSIELLNKHSVNFKHLQLFIFE